MTPSRHHQAMTHPEHRRNVQSTHLHPPLLTSSLPNQLDEQTKAPPLMHPVSTSRDWDALTSNGLPLRTSKGSPATKRTTSNQHSTLRPILRLVNFTSTLSKTYLTNVHTVLLRAGPYVEENREDFYRDRAKEIGAGRDLPANSSLVPPRPVF
ncbi:hypothetical protein PtB15_11B311 [Puccinia triticina]|nr:hypothetical protein PtB15_11B311 [Puccinia triticina]